MKFIGLKLHRWIQAHFKVKHEQAIHNVGSPFNRLVPKAVENSDFARNLRSAKIFLASANT